MSAVLAVLLLVLLKPGTPTVEALPFSQMASGSESVARVLSGRAHFGPVRQPSAPSVFWIRLSLRTTADDERSWVLSVPSGTDLLQAYLPAKQGYRLKTLGISIPYAVQPQAYARPAIDLPSEALSGRPMYLRVRYIPDTPFFVRISTQRDTIVNGFETRIVQGLFFGVLLAIGLCNLYVALVVRVRSAAFFVAYVLALFLNELVATGLGSHYLWPNAAPDLRTLTFLTNTLAFLTGLLFTRSFLQTRYAAPNWDRALIAWFIAEVTIDSLRHALPNGMALAPLLLAVQLGGMLITVAAGIVRMRQGFGPARFFVLAFAPAIAGYMANLAYDIYLPAGRWFFASNGVEFGFMFESIIFSFSLLDRIRTLDEANVRLRTLVARDSLTGLYNRAAFFEQFDQEIVKAKESKRGFGILYIDLDNFKNVNDRYGHHTGDLLLQIVARRLRMAVRETDTIARLGGDEFAILVSGVNSTDALEAARADVMHIADKPVTIEGNTLRIGISAGSALFPQDGDKPDRLIEVSDRAMYAVKQARRIIAPVIS